MSASHEEHAAPPVVEQFVKALVVANKAVALYPPSSNIPKDTSEQAAKALREALRTQSELRLVVTKQGLYCDDAPLLHGNAAYLTFALELYNRRLAEVRFHSGAKATDLVAFLSVLKYTPEQIAGAGGFESRLWDLNVTTVTVTEASVSIVGADQVLDSSAEAAELTRDEIENMLADFASGRSRDRMVMARFIASAQAVSTYLREVFDEEDGTKLGLARAFDRFAEFAQIVQASPTEVREPLLKSLAEALKLVEPEVRQAMLVDHILPQSRTDESLAAVLCEMDFQELCRLLIENMDPESAAQEGLARALRNLSVITGTDRDTLAEAAGGAMRSAGFSETDIEGVIETAQPSRLDLPGVPSTKLPVRRPVDAVLHMLDAAAVDERDGSIDEGLRDLQEEARRGVTDGDVIMAFVTLVTVDHREQQFSSMMAMLEDSLDLLVERGELELAADAADALRLAADDPSLSHAQRGRIEASLGRLTKPEDIRTMAHALRIHRPGTEENDAARRLLASLGPMAVDPLLEQLAEEPDMSVRKSLVDLLSEMAPNYFNEIGSHVSDPRWYVVRNVVAILGSTHSSAMLPYLERTLRHHEVRVRRETIRALSGIQDRVAHEMLVHALTDDDAQNVQLAARYLGVSKVMAAIPALEQVARGEGRGNREVGPRVEAIETLGTLGARQSLSTLEGLAGRRTIIGAGKTRELASAADAAIGRIRRGGGGS